MLFDTLDNAQRPSHHDDSQAFPPGESSIQRAVLPNHNPTRPRHRTDKQVSSTPNNLVARHASAIHIIHFAGPRSLGADFLAALVATLNLVPNSWGPTAGEALALVGLGREGCLHPPSFS